MEIISFSIDEETLGKIEKIMKEGTFNGRSELIRKAIEKLYQDTVSNKKLEGRLNSIIVTRYPHEKAQEIAQLSHQFDTVISTQLHSKLNDEKSLELFHTNSKAGKVIEFYNQLEGSKHTDSVNMIPQDQ